MIVSRISSPSKGDNHNLQTIQMYLLLLSCSKIETHYISKSI